MVAGVLGLSFRRVNFRKGEIMTDLLPLVLLAAGAIFCVWLGWQAKLIDRDWIGLQTTIRHNRGLCLDEMTAEQLLDLTIDAHRGLQRIEHELQDRLKLDEYDPSHEGQDLFCLVFGAVYEGRGWKELLAEIEKEERRVKS